MNLSRLANDIDTSVLTKKHYKFKNEGDRQWKTKLISCKHSTVENTQRMKQCRQSKNEGNAKRGATACWRWYGSCNRNLSRAASIDVGLLAHVSDDVGGEPVEAPVQSLKNGRQRLG